ncbi:MAG: tRNA (adenosine(37)-N6)-threonylcarbamoyltransferase complex dimerization subunit type 1 TsaB [Methylicorpusculum sp.]|nr:tRNA (adenosine(37)-N6)-threonylcarbamoyltransferase complex dimerization subunit type 1 TsaB [Methylicorpusculum sp.]
MKLLAVETATEACSAALFINGEIREHFELAPRTHTQRILPMIEALMTEADLRPQQLDAVAFGCGPGSFTGVRIATGVIQGIAFGADLPVVPISTLAALAQDAFDSTNESVIFSAIDARLSEIFWAVYLRDANGFAELVGKENVIPADLADACHQKGIGVGSAWRVYSEVLLAKLTQSVISFDADRLPRAAAVASLGVRGMLAGRAVSVEVAMPVYLRDKVAKKESER